MTAVEVDGLHAAAVALVERSRAAQGLEPTIADPTAIGQLAVLVDSLPAKEPV